MKESKLKLDICLQVPARLWIGQKAVPAVHQLSV